MEAIDAHCRKGRIGYSWLIASPCEVTFVDYFFYGNAAARLPIDALAGNEAKRRLAASRRSIRDSANGFAARIL
jgi:hypothetical protein